jgi:hypothetical protein
MRGQAVPLLGNMVLLGACPVYNFACDLTSHVVIL